MILGLVFVATAARAQLVQDFPVGSVEALVVAPDGALWYTTAENIGRISPDGVMQPPFNRPIWDRFTIGPDGDIWFTQSFENRIGRMATDGSITHYPLPQGQGGPVEIAASPSGDIWFSFGQGLGRLSSDASFSQFPLPDGLFVSALVAGPDEAIWFAAGARVGRITSAGVVRTYPIPQASTGIAADTDAVWSWSDRQVYRITTTGAVTVFPLRYRASQLAPRDREVFITYGWGLNAPQTHLIGRLTASGEVTDFGLPGERTVQSYPQPIAVTPGGIVWFAESINGQYGLGRVDSRILALDPCEPSADPPNPNVSRTAVDFESVPEGSPPEAISIPGIQFRGAGISASVEDTTAYTVLDALSGKALVWMQREQDVPCCDWSHGLAIEFTTPVNRFRARIAMRSRYTHTVNLHYESGSSGRAGSIPVFLTRFDEMPVPNVPFFNEGLIDLQIDPTGQSGDLRRVVLSVGGVDSVVLSDTLFVLDNIEVSAVPLCAVGVPEIVSHTASDIPVVSPGTLVNLTWTPAANLAVDGDYVVEASRDCSFNSPEVRLFVSETAATLMMPSVPVDSLVYVRVYAREQCPGNGVIYGPGSLRLFEVTRTERGIRPLSEIRSHPRVVERP
jgi:virginiamycin B lyase